MKTIFNVKIISLVTAIVLIVLIFITLRHNKDITEKQIYMYDREEPVIVQVDTVRTGFSSDGESFVGFFEPQKESKVSAETQGRIDHFLVDVGDRVVKGQVLVQLDNTMLKHQLSASDVQIDGLKADVSRFSILAAADAVQGVQLEKAELGLRAAEVQRRAQADQVRMSTVRAPFSGIVTAKYGEVGTFAAPGVPLVRVTDISLLKFTINVAETHLPLFREKARVTVTADVYPNLPLKSTTTMVGSKANDGSSFLVQFTVNNTKDFKLKAGMFGRVSMGRTATESVILIPAVSLTGTADTPMVYTVRDGKARLTSIMVGERLGDKLAIKYGLASGDLVVTSGLLNLVDGANVKISNGDSK